MSPLTDPTMAKREMYTHSYVHRGKDPDNCAACALNLKSPNYAAWPLLYIAAHRPMPKKAFLDDVADASQDNLLYLQNIVEHLEEYGHPGWLNAH